MLRAYKYRIYPDPRQKELIDKTFGCCRWVYNTCLYLRKWLWETRKAVSAYDLMKQVSETKLDCPWLKEPDSQALNAAILNMDQAYQHFFKHGMGFPRYKKRNGHQSFSCPCNTREVNWETSTLTIPKIQDIPIVLSRRFKGKIKTVTISRTPTRKYYASILVDTGEPTASKPPVDEDKTIGIDLGIKDFAITSEGIKISNPKYLDQKIDRLKVLQHRASHHKKGSGKRKKANLRVAIQHERITNQRKDFLHKLSTKLVCENQATSFVVENLAVRNMVKNHHLAKAISDAGWSEFVRQLKYKSEWYGKNFIQIGRFEPSSKTCSHCGAINQTLTLQDREWVCGDCGTCHDRDINAARNIKHFGLKTGAGSSEVPVKQRRLRRAMKRESILPQSI